MLYLCRFLILFIIGIVLPRASTAFIVTATSECISAADFGQGSVFYVPANPNELSVGTNALISTTPENMQVAPWVATNRSALASAIDPSDATSYNTALRIYVSGYWYPWGSGSTVSDNPPECKARACDSSITEESPCMDNGVAVVAAEQDNMSCVLKNGLGLYGLIAVTQADGTTHDPNDPVFAKTLPGEFFRTFRIDAKSTDADGNYFELPYTKQCNIDSSGKTVCVIDTDANGANMVAKGALYFKILDRYYGDNVGGYNVVVANGLASKEGIVESIISGFQDSLNQTSQDIYVYLTKENTFVSICRSVVLFYIVLTGLMFAMGLIRAYAAEFVIRILKASFVLIMISPGSWQFFNTYLFSLFTDGAQSIAHAIAQNIFEYSKYRQMGSYSLSDDASVLTVFDAILEILISPSVQNKILALWIYNYRIFFAFFLYICIVIILISIFRCIVIYISSILLITFLLSIAPILMIMILFSLTKETFDTWLKQLIVNAMAVIVVAVCLSIMVNLVLDQFFNILYYKVCMTTYTMTIGAIKIADFSFWAPSDAQQVDEGLSPTNVFSLLFTAVLFDVFMKQVPEMIDNLANAALMPVSTLSSGMTNALRSSSAYQFVSTGVSAVRAPLLYISPFNAMARRGGGLINTVEAKFNQVMSGSAVSGTNVIRDAYDWVSRSAVKVRDYFGGTRD